MPLLAALKKVCGNLGSLEYLESFRYPLAGEFSMRTEVLQDLRMSSDWGLEIGVLYEMQRNYSLSRICQVDIADAYDHKHQTLSLSDVDSGLSKMSIDISKAMFRKLVIEGEIFSMGKFRTIKATYYRMALDFVKIYANDAVMNGLNLDRHSEEKAVEMFAQNVMSAGRTFLDTPPGIPVYPGMEPGKKCGAGYFRTPETSRGRGSCRVLHPIKQRRPWSPGSGHIWKPSIRMPIWSV